MSGDVTGFVLGQSIHRHVPSVFAQGIDAGSSRMQRLSAVSSTIQGSGKRREAMSHHLSRIVDNEPIAATNAITVAASAAPM